MAKWKHWFTTLIIMGSAQAWAVDDPACEEMLMSYSQQRSGDAPDLVAKVREHSQKIQKSLSANPMNQKIREWVGRFAPSEAYRKSVSMGPGKQVKLRQPFYDGLWEVVLESKGEDFDSIDLLLESREISKDPQLAFEGFLASPDQQHLAIQYREYGSIDNSRILIYNLENDEILADLTAGYGYAWASNQRLIFEDAREKEAINYGLRVYDLDRDRTTTWSRTGTIGSTYKDWTLVTKGSQNILLHDGDEFELGYDFPAGVLFGGDDKYLYFRTADKTWSNNKVIRLEIESLETNRLYFKDVIPENAYRMADSGYRDGHIFLERTFGEHLDVAIYKVDGTFVATIPLEGGVTVRDWAWEKVGEVVSLTLSNQIHSSFTAQFDIGSKSFLGNVNQDLMTGPKGETYRSCVIHATSSDGIRVPVRLFYKQIGRGGNPCTGGRFAKTRPALIEAYGGFFLGGSFRSSYDPMYKEFLDRGGVLVGPALRGGNEFGGSWHHAGHQLAKPNTLNDLIATAEELVARGISSPAQIISTGSSNGGFVVAASASLRPDLFGLTIPVNGVLDWSMATSLDPEFNGWSLEYGDSTRDEISSMKVNYSPVNRARLTKYNKMLVVTGLNDSRVNPKHSYNFVKAMEKGPTPRENIQWLAVKNTGHWAMSLHRQGLTARYIQAVVWSAIFEQAGFKK